MPSVTPQGRGLHARGQTVGALGRRTQGVPATGSGSRALRPFPSSQNNRSSRNNHRGAHTPHVFTRMHTPPVLALPVRIMRGRVEPAAGFCRAFFMSSRRCRSFSSASHLAREQRQGKAGQGRAGWVIGGGWVGGWVGVRMQHAAGRAGLRRFPRPLALHGRMSSGACRPGCMQACPGGAQRSPGHVLHDLHDALKHGTGAAVGVGQGARSGARLGGDCSAHPAARAWAAPCLPCILTHFHTRFQRARISPHQGCTQDARQLTGRRGCRQNRTPAPRWWPPAPCAATPRAPSPTATAAPACACASHAGRCALQGWRRAGGWARW